MKLETIKEKKNNNISKLEQAKLEVDYIQMKLGENLKYINDVLQVLKKLKKIEYCFNYIKEKWYCEFKSYKDIDAVKKRIKDCSNVYEKKILERKILKLKLKQAQREFTKKQKSFIRFEKKYFNEEV